MSAILELVTGNVLPYLIAAGAAMLALIGAYFKGGANARAKQAAKDAKAFHKTTEDVSRETISDDPVSDIRDRLRERGRKS